MLDTKKKRLTQWELNLFVSEKEVSWLCWKVSWNFLFDWVFICQETKVYSIVCVHTFVYTSFFSKGYEYTCLQTLFRTKHTLREALGLSTVWVCCLSHDSSVILSQMNKPVSSWLTVEYWRRTQRTCMILLMIHYMVVEAFMCFL